MRIKNLILAVSITASFGIMAFGATTVFARESESGGSDSSNSSITQNSTQIEDSKIEAQKKLEEAKREAQKKLEESKREALKQLEEKKKNIVEKTDAERQKICSEKSAEITKKINKKTADATKHMATFDKIYNRVKEFKVNNNLNPANYDSLVANVDAKAKNAQASIEALKSVNTTIDCTKVDSAKTAIATFVESLKQTRESLKAYRTAIKDLTVAVKTSIGESTKPESQENETSSTNTRSTN